MTDARYYHRDDLPWGWWLRSVDGVIEDGQGRIWHSVREAFWEGRLGMRSEHLAGEQQELLLRVLGSVDAHWLGGTETRHDLFGGDMLFWRFYMCWLGSVGLLAHSGRVSALEAPLSDEGRAALIMLRATRVPGWVDLPMRALVDAVVRSALGPADAGREAALRAFEHGMTPMATIFAREEVGGAHLVTMTSLDLSERMPVRRRSWSASFLDRRVRDDLFGWLAERVHRWNDWAELVRLRGAGHLTAHLLSLLVANPIVRTAEARRAGHLP